jgi:hypothetical protein
VHSVEATDDAPAGTWKDFLPESEGLGGAATQASVGRLLVGGGTRKEEGLVSPDDASNTKRMWCQPCSCPPKHVPATPFLQT